jgi:O-antigen ligase
MRAWIGYAGAIALLGAPTALAFFSGGYFDEPRAWAGLAVWLLVAIAVLSQPRAVPRTRNAWLALLGLALTMAWTLASMAWAPLAGPAYHAGQLVALYTGALLAAILLLRTSWALRAVEPALVGGAAVVVGYGLAGRLLPGVLHFAHSISAHGRLEQPLTYWNAMGELAAMGLVLAVRVAGSADRPPIMRALAAASCAPLGMGLYLTFSRGALFACAAGLIVLLAAAPRREQLESACVAVGAGTLAALAAAPFPGLTSVGGSLATREHEGLVALVALLAIGCVAATAQRVLARRRHTAPLALPRSALAMALAAASAGLALVIVAGAASDAGRQISTGAGRLVTLASNRSDFWRVALRAFASEPLRGIGAGGWQVWWLRLRPFNGFARDAHSLPLQTAAELGLIGALLLGAFFAGVALAARSGHRTRPAIVAGPIAALVVYAAHAPLDWDWEMPAVTLIAIVLAGAVIALGEGVADNGPPLAQRVARLNGSTRQKLRTARTKVLADPAEELAS